MSKQTETLEAGFCVGSYLVEPQLLRVTKDDEEVQVQPKVMEVLLCLAEAPGRVVTKEEFMERVWDDAIVTNDALLRCISILRKIFDDDARDPAFIETIRTRGYRLIAPVSPIASEQGTDPESAPETAALSIPAVEDRPAEPSRKGGAWSRIWHEALSKAREPQALAVTVVALILLTAAAFSVRSVLTPNPPAPLQTVPLTTFPRQETDPAVSPAGDRVAFVWNGGEAGNFNLYVKEVGSETPLQLTAHPSPAHSPAWSPDGRRLAFVRSSGGKSEVFIIPANGGSEQRVVGLEAREIYRLAWSPNGQTLALSAQTAPYEAFSLYLLSLETLEKKQLTTPPPDIRGDLEPAFSPDGERIVFLRSTIDKIEDVYVVSVHGGEARRLTYDNAEITGVDWTSDGRSVVFASDRAGAASLWRIPSSGGGAEWVATVEGGGMHQPSVARNGERLVFVQKRFETNIWERSLVSKDTSAAVQKPLISSTRWDSSPDIAPDGRHIAFASSRSGSYEIWVADKDGSHPRQLTHFHGHVTDSPSFSPDGRQIAFVSRQEGSAHVYVVSVAGGEPRRLTSSAFNDKAPSWSRDGRWIYFASNRSGHWETWKIPATGGEAHQVTTEGGFAAFESPDREALFYVKRNAPGIWRRPASGGKEERVTAALEPQDWGNWAVTEQGLYFVRRDEDKAVVVVRDLRSGEEEIVAVVDRLTQRPSLAISPDGRWMLYGRLDRDESDLLLVEDFE